MYQLSFTFEFGEKTMCVLRDHFSAIIGLFKPIPPGLYTRLLALKVSRYLYHKIPLFMSNFAKGNNRKNKITFFLNLH